MDDCDFWEIEGPVAADQAIFLGRLRALVCPPFLSCFRESDDSLLFTVDVDAPDRALLTGAVRLEPGRIRGDRLDIHNRDFFAVPSEWAMTYTGEGAELAVRAADWFRAFADRPIVRHEWVHEDKVYAHCYLLTDTGENLSQMFRDDLAPRGLKKRLGLAGNLRNGWVQSSGLGSPDRIVPIRGHAVEVDL